MQMIANLFTFVQIAIIFLQTNTQLLLVTDLFFSRGVC